MDGRPPRGHYERRATGGVEVAVLERPLRAIERLVRVAPGVVRGPAPAVGPGDGHARGRRPAPLVHDLQGEASRRLAFAALADGPLLAATPPQVEHPQGRVGPLV